MGPTIIPVCEINIGPIDNVHRKSRLFTGIRKAVDRLAYGKSYKILGFLAFVLGLFSSVKLLSIKAMTDNTIPFLW